MWGVAYIGGGAHRTDFDGQCNAIAAAVWSLVLLAYARWNNIDQLWDFKPGSLWNVRDYVDQVKRGGQQAVFKFVFPSEAYLLLKFEMQESHSNKVWGYTSTHFFAQLKADTLCTEAEACPGKRMTSLCIVEVISFDRLTSSLLPVPFSNSPSLSRFHFNRFNCPSVCKPSPFSSESFPASRARMFTPQVCTLVKLLVLFLIQGSGGEAGALKCPGYRFLFCLQKFKLGCLTWLLDRAYRTRFGPWLNCRRTFPNTSLLVRAPQVSARLEFWKHGMGAQNKRYIFLVTQNRSR
jgi:hypothetical protein